MNRPALCEKDYRKLAAIVGTAKKGRGPGGAVRLGERLAEAAVFEDFVMGESFVKMGSCVRLRDLDRDLPFSYRLVFPGEADIDRGRISILSPLGAALIGRKEGESFSYESPGGRSQVRVEEVRHAD